LFLNSCVQISNSISYGTIITSGNIVIGNPLTYFQFLANNYEQEFTQGDMNSLYVYNQRIIKDEWTEWQSKYPIQLRQMNRNKQTDMWPTIEQVHSPDGTAKDPITRFMQPSFPLEYPDEPDAAPPDVGHQM